MIQGKGSTSAVELNLKIDGLQFFLKSLVFTLYLFRGKSLSFMGFKKEAIEDYEFVIENAPDNSDFTNFAHQLLNELKSK